MTKIESFTRMEKIASEIGWVIPKEGENCICPKCKSTALIKGGKEFTDEWGDVFVYVTRTCPNCGTVTVPVEKDWVSKADLISCLW